MWNRSMSPSLKSEGLNMAESDRRSCLELGVFCWWEQ